jgi:hypothetical protein
MYVCIYSFLLQMNHQCVLNIGAGQLGVIACGAAHGICRL